MPPSPALRPLSTAAAVLLSVAAGAALHHVRHGNSTAPSTAAAPGAAAAETNARPGSAAARPAMPTRESLSALSPEAQITALAAALPQMEVADLLPLVEHLLKARHITTGEAPADPFAAPPPDLISPLLRALFTRWAELDNAGMMAFVESGPLRYDYTTRRLAVLALVEVRGLSALEEVRAKSPALAREAAREMLIRNPLQLEALLPFLKAGYRGNSIDELIENSSEIEAQIAKALSPELYLRYLFEIGRNDEAERTLIELGRTDPQRALQAVKNLPPGPEQDNLLADCLLDIAPVNESSLLETDYTVFRREFEAMADGPAKNRLTPYYAIVRMLENPDAALQWAQGLTNPRLRTGALVAISGGLFASCKNTFLDFYGREGDAAERLIRQVAAAWIAAPPRDSDQIPFSGRWAWFFRDWHDKEPAASEAWLATVPNPELCRMLACRITSSLSKLFEFIPDAESRVRMAALRLYEAGTMPASTTWEDLSAELPAEYREAVHIQHLKDMPFSAGTWATLTPGERQALAGTYIQKQARSPEEHDPLQPSATGEAAAPRFLQTLNAMPPEERSLGAYYEAGAAYIKRDEAAASEWMESLPPGPERDAAATALVEHLVKPGDSRDGEAAFAWAAAMSGETERTRYTAEAARAWAAEDPAAARAAVEASALPAAEKSALLQSIPEGGAR